MDKSNFKKLALMGMTGGMLIASQSPANAETSCAESQTILSAKCGGPGGCSGYSAQKPQATCSGMSRPDKSYTADAQSEVQGQYKQGQGQRSWDQSRQDGKGMSENDLFSQLNEEGKSIYRGLDAEGKALALKLASQSDNKNDAVKMAAQRMAEKRAKPSYRQ